VRDAFPDATLIRPAVMFGPDDAFLNMILKLLRQLPAYPMFGDGATKLQPAYVEDAGNAIARAVEREETRGAAIECGGPACIPTRSYVAHPREEQARGIHVPLSNGCASGYA